jgi:mono/diheme cytochrome c family protein
MFRHFAVPALLATLVVAGRLAAQDTIPIPLPKPQQVNDSAIARGREVFHGAGNCAACHGVAGVGTDSGPALAQGVWMHGPDTYEGILQRVVHGIPKAYSTRGLTMPMRGWNTISDTEARDVAAYVWSISHAWSKPIRPKRPS